jgi:hypothetical protein
VGSLYRPNWRRAVGATNQRGHAVTERLLLDFDAFFLEHRLCGRVRSVSARVQLATVIESRPGGRRTTAWDRERVPSVV